MVDQEINIKKLKKTITIANDCSQVDSKMNILTKKFKKLLIR